REQVAAELTPAADDDLVAGELEEDRLQELARRAGARGEFARRQLFAIGARQFDKSPQAILGLLRQHRRASRLCCDGEATGVQVRRRPPGHTVAGASKRSARPHIPPLADPVSGRRRGPLDAAGLRESWPGAVDAN